MYTVKFTNKFKKNYKLMIKRGKDISLLDSVVNTLMSGKQLSEKYRDYELTSTLKGYRECHIKPDWLLIYYVENDVLVLTLVDTGSHSDLF
jgi:mRNA interferase YafQ